MAKLQSCLNNVYKAADYARRLHVNQWVRSTVILPEPPAKSCRITRGIGGISLSVTYTYWYSDRPAYLREVTLDSSLDKASQQAAANAHGAMNDFLAAVERKGFVMARIALRHEADAYDAVQDTMIRLVRSYADRPRDEWKPLFYRILKNRIVDLQRRRMVRQRVMAWLPVGERDSDPIAEAPAQYSEQPDRQLELDESMDALGQAVRALPARQQQAFLLRTIEGMSVQLTAAAMGCSPGSVKTHYSRAVHSLRKSLGEDWGGAK